MCTRNCEARLGPARLPIPHTQRLHLGDSHRKSWSYHPCTNTGQQGLADPRLLVQWEKEIFILGQTFRGYLAHQTHTLFEIIRVQVVGSPVQQTDTSLSATCSGFISGQLPKSETDLHPIEVSSLLLYPVGLLHHTRKLFLIVYFKSHIVDSQNIY